MGKYIARRFTRETRCPNRVQDIFAGKPPTTFGEHSRSIRGASSSSAFDPENFVKLISRYLALRLNTKDKEKRKDRKYFGRPTSRLARPKLAGVNTHYDSGAAVEVAASK